GTPLFSGGNNPLSRLGSCVAEDWLPPSNALADINAKGCPVPCNPTWGSSDVQDVCGSSAACCQVRPLETKDCVFDPALGDGGCWRPVTGDDIVGLGGLDATDWASTAHATHQDPSGISCQLFAQGVPADVLDKNGLTTQDVLLACYHRLSVANQHGYCVFGVNVCPMAAPSFIDACEQINLDESRSGC
ncbi:MAG: hypothetical protein KC457_22225, partial [Myxococcales bacterium]|nr:hypothetical protein [Myxococcales bacterium]